MTLEGEYYDLFSIEKAFVILVAILMTLEGEYYSFTISVLVKSFPSQSS